MATRPVLPAIYPHHRLQPHPGMDTKLIDAARLPGEAGPRLRRPARQRWGSERSEWGRSEWGRSPGARRATLGRTPLAILHPRRCLILFYSSCRVLWLFSIKVSVPPGVNMPQFRGHDSCWCHPISRPEQECCSRAPRVPTGHRMRKQFISRQLHAVRRQCSSGVYNHDHDRTDRQW